MALGLFALLVILIYRERRRLGKDDDEGATSFNSLQRYIELLTNTRSELKMFITCLCLYNADLLEISARPDTFTYMELKTATENFSPTNKLGEGGFGPVFKVSYSL